MKARSLLLSLVLLAACGDDEPPVTPPATLAEGIYGPLGTISPSATPEQQATFDRGLAVAEYHFQVGEGLGPEFNTSFCGSCHNRPFMGGSSGRYRNFLLPRQELSDGSVIDTGVNGVQPFLQLENPVRRPTDEGTTFFATRSAIPFYGVGFLAEIYESSILAHSDPDDANGDGISGRPNYDRGFVGRFGRKAQTVSIEGFIRGPLFNHLGITSYPLPDARKDALPVPSGSSALASRAGGLAARGGGLATRRGALEVATVRQAQAAAPDEPTFDDDDAPDPELSEQQLFDLVSFAMLLAAPEAETGPEVEAAKVVFEQLGCAGCHVPTLEGSRGLVPLYSDLLLHDMGPELDDGIRMGISEGAEFRTQPLWGVAVAGPWLHDGRADTLDEAIRLHGGEASASRDAYLAASDAERAEVIFLLESLGGRKLISEGRIHPEDALPEVGALGGPRSDLSGAELDAFWSGRQLFDRDFGLSAGLGPRFNGDACRACHSEPVFGGAGPVGLDVMRHGRVDSTGGYTDPVEGSIAHRLVTELDARAPFDGEANVFEMRQAQPLFGLGLAERIPEADIRALADPSDADGDGIRGVVQELPDGRLGRFGWKADIPSLAEFVRDAFTNEMGLTLSERAGMTFGLTSDGDAFADPEVSEGIERAIDAYVAGLAAPARRSLDAAAEARGEALFAQVGCEECHVGSWEVGGARIGVYSDFLLHETQPEDYVGITVLNASGRAFRTAPLWGVDLTGPYMHDGTADTLEAAIARHYGEGSPSATAFSALSTAERADLLSFLRSL